MEIIKKFWLFILIGIFLRIFIAAFTFHPDVGQPALASAIFFQHGSLDFYQQTQKAPLQILDDLPLAYLINLPIHILGRFLVSVNVENIFLMSSDQLLGNIRLWVYLVYLKLPFIIFDIGLAVLLAYSVRKELQRRALLLWLFNPITLWVSSAIGQFDIYPAFFMISTWYFLRREKLNLAALSLGLGGAIKFAPFLLLPLLIHLGKNIQDKVILTLISFLPFMLTVFPYLPNPEFRQNALFAPQLSKSLFAQIPLSGGEVLFFSLTSILFIYLVYFSKKRQTDDFLPFSLTTLLMLLALTHFHIQWFLWVTPFLIIWLLNNIEWGNILATTSLFLSLIVMLFLFDSSLQFKLFAPLIPFLNQSVGLAEILTSQQIWMFRSLSASVFFASSLFLSTRVLKILR